MVKLIPIVSRGCLLVGGAHCTDVSRRQEYLGAYKIGDVFRLRQPAQLFDSPDMPRYGPGNCVTLPWLVPEHPMPTTDPAEIRPHENARPLALVPAGTRLALHKIVLHDYVTMARLYYIFK